MSTSFPKK